MTIPRLLQGSLPLFFLEGVSVISENALSLLCVKEALERLREIQQMLNSTLEKEKAQLSSSHLQLRGFLNSANSKHSRDIAKSARLLNYHLGSSQVREVLNKLTWSLVSAAFGLGTYFVQSRSVKVAAALLLLSDKVCIAWLRVVYRRNAKDRPAGYLNEFQGFQGDISKFLKDYSNNRELASDSACNISMQADYVYSANKSRMVLLPKALFWTYVTYAACFRNGKIV